MPAETPPDTSAEADYSTDTQAMDETGRVVHGQPDLSIDINHNGSGSLDASAVAGADGSLSLTIPSIAVDSDRITAAKNEFERQPDQHHRYGQRPEQRHQQQPAGPHQRHPRHHGPG